MTPGREKGEAAFNGFIGFVPFFLDDHWYALHLDVVEHVIPAVEITPLPKSPEIVLGLINIRGGSPDLNLRRRFRLPDRENKTYGQFHVADTSKRRVGAAGIGQQGSFQITMPK